MKIEYFRMMQMSSALLVFLGASLPSVASASHGLRGGGMHGSAKKRHTPGHAPAAAVPEGALDAATVTWEIENMNYFGLTDKWTGPMESSGLEESFGDDAPKKKKKKMKKDKNDKEHFTPPEDLEDMAKGFDKGFEKMGDDFGDAIDDVAETADAGAEANKKKGDEGSTLGDGVQDVLGTLGNLGKKSLFSHSSTSLLQLARKAVTVQKALRAGIELAVEQVVGADCAMPFPAPAPAPAPMPLANQIPSGLRLLARSRGSSIDGSGHNASRQFKHISGEATRAPAPATAIGPIPVPAPGPAPGPAGCAKPKIHVTFALGDKMKARHAPLLNKPRHKPLMNTPVFQRRTTIVKVTLTDRPNNGVNDLHLAKTLLQNAVASGQLKHELRAAIVAVTGVTPKIKGLKVKSAIIKPWDVKECGNHMTKVVNLFSVHYSRAQVPAALYNECTNFMTKISFSHDYVLDHRDAARCRKATREFAKRWNYGQKATAKNHGEHNAVKSHVFEGEHNAVKSHDFEPMCVSFCEAKYGNNAPMCHAAAGDKLIGQPL